MRHPATSLAVSADVNVTAVQRMPGYKPAAMTLDVCANLFDTDLGAVGRALHEVAAGVLRNRALRSRLTVLLSQARR
jgi:hypothetical protein